VTWGLVTMAFTLILLFGRVALGYHYPSDVLGGAAIGAAAALLLWVAPIRNRIDLVVDRAGEVWDHAVDKLLALALKPVRLR
jgi:membrane-associated phospholipid phosphatase